MSSVKSCQNCGETLQTSPIGTELELQKFMTHEFPLICSWKCALHWQKTICQNLRSNTTLCFQDSTNNISQNFHLLLDVVPSITEVFVSLIWIKASNVRVIA